MAAVRPPITDIDPESEVYQDALAQGAIAKARYEKEEDISKHIKDFFDAKYSPNWHCVVGRDFANCSSCEHKTSIFFYVGQIAILLYKLG